MPKRRTSTSTEQELVKSIRHLEKVIRAFPDEYKYLFHPGKNLWLNFLRGVVYGLGILAAVAIVIPLIIATLRSIEWVPLIGDFMTDIIEQIEEVRPPSLNH